jgi:hypothetical protein
MILQSELMMPAKRVPLSRIAIQLVQKVLCAELGATASTTSRLKRQQEQEPLPNLSNAIEAALAKINVWRKEAEKLKG